MFMYSPGLSFGLHSPDNLPGGDVNFEDMEGNVKLTPEGTVEVINSVYTERTIGGQRILIDPDIIGIYQFFCFFLPFTTPTFYFELVII